MGFGPGDIHQLFTGLEIPDPITFVLSPQYLDRPSMYPRQATLLKVIFLRYDLLTEYDHMVIDEWEQSFRTTGDNGIVPGVRDRMRYLRAEGRKWFRETLLVMGRRAGKGHISGLSMSYVLWNYMAKGDPQGYYGVDRDKKLQAMVFAGKRDQAKATVWQDMVNYITGSACFGKYIRAPLQAEKLSVYAPHDFVRMQKRMNQGINPDDINMATFEIVPKESTLMAGRGPTSFMQAYDEMAHVVASGANRSAEEVYCLDPMTRVLCADLIWRPIKELQPGDKLVGFDEEAEAPGKQRKLRESTVLAKWSTQGEAYRLTFADGTSVVCSANHRWFRVTEDCNSGKWVKTAYTRRDGSAGSTTRLKVGDYIRHIVDPWEVDDSREGGYLAGILDGEGWVGSPQTSAFKVGMAQNPGLVLDRSLEIFKKFGFNPYQWKKHPGRDSICEQVEVRGIADCLRLLGQIRPERLLAKSVGLWANKVPRGYTKHKQIASIELLPEQELVDIETSTKTFIAEGLVSHNSAATPSLDQFGFDGFIIEPSSPWQMLGQFYTNYCNSLLEDESGNPVYPEMLTVQLTSWDIYKDWEIAHTIEVFPPDFRGDLGEYPEGMERICFDPLKGAIQAYDDQMARLEQANPDTFKVERRSRFAVALDAYLNEQKVREIFQPWEGRLIHFGGPQLGMQEKGRLDIDYKAHGDPSKCLAADSYVFSDQGVMRITQVEEGDRLVNAEGTDRVAEWMESGEKEIHRLRLQYSHEVRGSIEHPVLTQRGWVRLGDLVPRQDRVRVVVGAEQWSSSQVEVPRVRVSKHSDGIPCHPVAKVDERMGRLLGYIVSEGCIQSYMLTITFHVDEPTGEESIDLIRELFGLEPTWERTKGKGRTVGWNSTHLMATLEALGLGLNVSASQKQIPWAVLQSPREVVVEFLRAYFSGDGHATTPAAKDRLASVSTASPVLAQQVQILLLNLGIVAQRESWWVTINEEGGRRQYWRLNMRGEYLRRFAAEVGFLEGFEPKRGRLRELALFPVKPVAEKLFLPVMEVVPDGVEQTYDLRMESGEHNFAANGLVCHNSNANFGLALAHAEPGADGKLHVVFDKIHHFWPGDFEDHIVDYDEIEEWIWSNMLAPFMPQEMTFDQFNSAQVIQRLARRSRRSGLPKTTQVYEKTATKQHNWQRAEIFKTAVNLGMVHAPYYEQGELELRFLLEKNGVVDHPVAGPVQTKDVADAMMECVMSLIGDQIISLRSELGSMRPSGAMLEGIQPFSEMTRPDEDTSVFNALAGFGKSRGMRTEQMRHPGRRNAPRSRR
jgi:hypothetical protein